jgi:hypothetical protein
VKKKKAGKKAKGASNNEVPKIEAAEAPAAASAVVDSAPPRILTRGPHDELIAMPWPEELQRQAEEEPNYRDLSQYASVIGTLREKGFSYRDIADWLSQRGVEVDHNAVYRVYRNSLSDYDAHLESQREDREAQEEAERNR